MAKRRLRTLTVGRRVVATLVATVTFVLAIAGGALLHLNLSQTRTAAATLTSQLLSSLFDGTITVESLSRLRADEGLTAEGIEVTDPSGRRVLFVESVAIDVDLMAIALRALAGYQKLSITLNRVEIRSPEVFLLPSNEKDPDGTLRSGLSIADAFELSDQTPSEPGGREIRIWLPKVKLLDVFARAALSGEEAIEARVSHSEASLLASNSGVAIDVKRFELETTGLGGVDARAEGEVHIRAPGAIWGEIDGSVGEIPLTQRFRYDDKGLDVEGTLPALKPEALRPLIADYPFDQTVSATNHIQGMPPRLNVDVTLNAASGSAKARGIVIISPEIEAELDVDTENLNLQALRSDLPETSLNVRSALSAWIADEQVMAELNATVVESRLNETDLPVVDVQASLSDEGILARATLHERGLPAHAEVSGPLSGPYAFSLLLKRTNLAESPRLALLSPLRGQVEGKAEGSLNGTAISLNIDLTGANLLYDDAQVGSLRVVGSAQGDLQAPMASHIEVTASARDLAYQQFTVKEAKLTGVGLASAPSVTLSGTTGKDVGFRIAADTHTDRILLERLEGTLSPPGKPLQIGAESVGYESDRLVVRKFSLEGEGKLLADLELGKTGGHVRLNADGLNLTRISSALDLGEASLGGRLGADVDLTLGQRSHGGIKLQIDDGAFRGLRGIHLTTDAKLDGRSFNGALAGKVDGLGTATAEWTTELEGAATEVSSYEHATGDLTAEVDGLELATFTALFGDALGVQRASGQLGLKAQIHRRSIEEFPEVHVSVNTRDLSADFGDKKNPHRVDGMGVSFSTRLDGAKSRAELAARVEDHLGEVLSVSGSATLPLERWNTEIPSNSELLDDLKSAPFELVLALTEREFEDFPAVVPMPALSGRFTARGVARGTLLDPNFDVALAAKQLAGLTQDLTTPLDVEASARYRPKTGALSGTVRARQGARRIGSATLDVNLPLEHLTGDTPKGTPLWTGNAQVVLDATPLELLSSLSSAELGGTVQGSVSITRTDWTPKFDADLRLRNLQVGSRPLGEGRLSALTSDGRLKAYARFDDEYGALEASAEVGLEATSALTKISNDSPILLTVQSDGYDAAVLSPFLTEVLSEFSGSLNGELKATLTPPHGEEDWRTSFAGKLALTEGIITPAAMGLRLVETEFQVSAAPEGKYNVVRVTELKAKARADVHNLKGNAVLYFNNVDLEKAYFSISQSKLPVLSEGTRLAEVTGLIKGQLTTTDGENRLTVEIPTMTAELPQDTDRSLTELTDNPTIEVLQPTSADAGQVKSKKSEPWNVDVHLGDDVRIKNTYINLKVNGDPSFRIADEMAISGKVGIQKGGRVQVLGRVFIVEHGNVSFDSIDPTDPHIDTAAVWRAPNGVVVRASISGTVKNLILEWSSDPPLPGGESEIIALVLGSGGGDTGGGAGVGMSLLAGKASEVLKESGLPEFDFYASSEGAGDGNVARLSDSRWDSYTAAVQISDELWFEGSYRTGSTGPEADPQSGFSGTLDWRFAPDWSARTEAGTLGLGADLLWQYRY